MEDENDSERLILFDNPRPRKKKYWQFVKMIAPPNQPMPLGGWKNKDCIGLYCMKCDMKLRYVLSDSKIITRHMHRVHQKELNDFLKAKEEISPETQPLSSEQSTNEEIINTHKRIKLLGNADQIKIMHLCTNWIAKHYRPIQIIEDEGFIELIEYVSSSKGSVSLPNRASLIEYIQLQASAYREQAKHQIRSEADFFCITTDILTSTTLSNLVSFTLHYLTRTFELRSWNLEIKTIDRKYSEQRISNMLDTICQDWNLPIDKIVLIILANAFNGVSAMQFYGDECVNCLSSTMHLVLDPLFFAKTTRYQATSYDSNVLVTVQEMEAFEDSLSNEDKNLINKIASTVKCLRSIARYFCKSSKGLQHLEALQGSENAIGCILDEVTHWSSSYDMLERMQLLQPAIRSFLDYCKSPVGEEEFPDFKKIQPNVEDWFVMEALLKLIKPFKVAMLLLSSEKYSTLAFVFPVLSLIKTNLVSSTIFNEIHAKYAESGIDIDENMAFIKQLQAYILHQFCDRFSNMPMDAIASSILHPGFSMMRFLCSAEKKEAQNFVVEEMMRLKSNRADYSIAIVNESAPARDERLMIRELLGEDNDEDETSGFHGAKEESLLRIQCINEFEAYLEVARVYVKDKSIDKCPFRWWNQHYHNFKLLAPVARKWLGCLTSCVSSEKPLKLLIKKDISNWSSLDDDLVRDLAFLHDNVYLENQSFET